MKIIFLIIFFFSYSKASEEIANVNVSTSAKTVNDIYRPVKTRDPMIASGVYSSKTGASTSYDKNIKNEVAVSTSSKIFEYSVLGIMDFYGNKEALLKNKEGEVFICRDGKIYDSKKKPAAEKKCEIKGRQIILKDLSGSSVKLSLEK
ncbi:MAG: hypothetical protein AB1637_03940 [Elusimicrobiota bacterium]